jgi:putative transposase
MLLGDSMYYYRHQRREDRALRSRTREIAITRIRYGYGRIYILLRRKGWRDNKKRVYRVYKEEGLNLRSKRPRRSKAGAHRLERASGLGLHQVWSMDFFSDALFDGRRFRCLIPHLRDG